MTVSSTMLVLNKAVLKAIPAPTTGTVALDLYSLIQAQPLFRASPKSNTSPHACPLSLIPSPLFPTLRFPRFPKLLHLCINASALLFQIGSSRARARTHTHTHTNTLTRTHTSVLLFQVGSSAIILWVLGKTGKRAWCGV